VSSYFIHGDISTHNLEHLTYNNVDPHKLSTIETLKPEELFAIADFAPAEQYDNIVGLSPFAGPVFKQTNKALFDTAVRGAWSGAKFWNIYGSAEPWNIIYAAWFLEDQARAANAPELAIHFKVIDGTNHFVRHSSLTSQRSLTVFLACLGGPRESYQGIKRVLFDLILLLFFYFSFFLSGFGLFYLCFRRLSRRGMEHFIVVYLRLMYVGTVPVHSSLGPPRYTPSFFLPNTCIGIEDDDDGAT
jgi:hypothetical protein